MSNYLPNHKHRLANVASVGSLKKYPSIFRFITESNSQKVVKIAKISVTILISGLLLMGIAIELVTLFQNLQLVRKEQQERIGMMGEVKSLQSIADRYTGYRDIYFRLAQLEYVLGNIKGSNDYLKKTVQLDPNFTQARVLGAHVKAVE